LAGFDLSLIGRFWVSPKAYGFRTYRVLELALYHSLGKLPEPESTHDFF
jgi:hypothetical protein